ncbi:MAG: hypothetical protein V2I53_13030 [Paracoccaceae bacterium]|jgi:hypothetical protein|nr:hypothetical protein [Paracoccaceae bacterium]
MSARRRLGPTSTRNWGWVAFGAVVALLCAAVGLDATLRAGPGLWTTAAPLVFGGAAAAAALWAWRQPPFERTALELTARGVAVEGRARRVHLAWDEIAAVTYRPSSMGPAHMTIERAAPAEGAEDALGDGVPGVLFPVRATGASAEEIAAFLARGAAEAGYALDEPLRGDARALHRFPGPRRWVLTRDGRGAPGRRGDADTSPE